jgi:hypothetical protein
VPTGLKGTAVIDRSITAAGRRDQADHHDATAVNAAIETVSAARHASVRTRIIATIVTVDQGPTLRVRRAVVTEQRRGSRGDPTGMELLASPWVLRLAEET